MIPEFTITGPTAFLTSILVILVLALPRRYVLVPFILTACFVPTDQYVDVAGLHFYVSRILVFVGIARLLVQGETRVIQWNRFDKLFLAWIIVGTAVFILRRSDVQAVIYKSGQLVEMLGVYWIVRQTIWSWTDLKRAAACFALSAIALAPFVALEWSTGVNPFLFLGARSTGFREGAFRCVASFRHPIIAGAFMACLVPFFIAQALTSRHRGFYWLAAAGSAFIVFASSSSTPIGGLGAVLFFCAAYRYRRYGRHMAIVFFGTLAFLHAIMQAPVWHLLSRVQFVGGSTGYHRYILIENAARHFSEWVALGTDNTSQWGHMMWDITNQYVLEGVRGGLVTLVLYVAVVAVAIRATGAYSQRHVPRDQQWLSWAVCTSLLGHCVVSLGLGYFGQIQILLYMTFGFAAFIYEQSALLSAPKGARLVKGAQVVPVARGYAAAPGPVAPQ